MYSHLDTDLDFQEGMTGHQKKPELLGDNLKDRTCRTKPDPSSNTEEHTNSKMAALVKEEELLKKGNWMNDIYVNRCQVSWN